MSSFVKVRFTLIELLVVIVIISILASMIVPALAMAREKAKGMRCVGNLKQVVLADLLYSDEHDDYLAPGSPPSGNLVRWHGSRISDTDKFQSKGGTLIPYIGEGGKITACPSLSNFDDTGFEKGCGGYGINQDFVGSKVFLIGYDFTDSNSLILLSDSGPKITIFKNAEETVAFGDSAFVSSGSNTIIEYSTITTPAWVNGWFGISPSHESTGFMGSPSIHFRHSGTANTGWLDGHIDPRKFSFTRPDDPDISKELYEFWNVGWFGNNDFQFWDHL